MGMIREGERESYFGLREIVTKSIVEEGETDNIKVTNVLVGTILTRSDSRSEEVETIRSGKDRAHKHSSHLNIVGEAYNAFESRL